MAAGSVDPQALSGHATGFNANVNGLRGLCVALVFVFHVASSGLAPVPAADSTWQLLLAYGVGSMAHGVEIFFMISGFVIVLSLRRHASVGAFLVDRCLRIFPLWMPLVLLIGLLWPWMGGQALPQPGAFSGSGWLAVVAANLVLLPPLLPLPMLHPASWSLTIEWLFYLAAAGAAVLTTWDRVPAAARWFVVAVLGTLALWHLPVALCFLIGVAVALAPQWLTPPSRWQWLAAPALGLFLLLWRSVDAAALSTGADLFSLLRHGQALPLLGALLAGVVGLACLSAPGSRAMPVLRTALLQRLGTISYSFYLWHLLVMFGAKRAQMRLWPEAAGTWAALMLFGAVSLALSWTLSAWSWRWLEQALGRWLRHKLAAVKPRPSASIA